MKKNIKNIEFPLRELLTRKQQKKFDKLNHNEKQTYYAKDLQGGTFGEDREYTIKEWVYQTMEWTYNDMCYGDESVIADERLLEGSDEEILGTIAEIWSLEFHKVQ